ncbi:hypothetical protein ACJJTC_014212 [Scirpophaga incertulas]
MKMIDTHINNLDSIKINCHEVDCIENLSNLIQTDTNLKIFSMNIRSIRKNFDHLNVTLQRSPVSYDVIILSECHLSEHSIIPILSGYRSFRTKKNINKNSGVVAYIRDSLCANVSELNFREADALLIDIPSVVTIMGVYRSPSFKQINSFLADLESYLEMYKNKENLVTAGDFNINIISDDYNTLNTDYLCLNAEYGLLPAITSATRNDSILDHIFVKSNKPTKGIVCKSDISDHYITIVDIALTKTQKVHTRKREVIKRNFEAIKADLGQVDWSDIYNNEDVNSAVSLFVEIVSAIIAKHSTAAILSRSKFCMKPWITPGLLRCMRHRDKLHIKARKSPQNDCLQITYRRYRNFCNKLLHKLKTQYERKEICESQNDPKRLWKTLRDICNITNKEKKPNNLLNVTGSTNANRSLDICNNYFSNIGQKLASDVLRVCEYRSGCLARFLSRRRAARVANYFPPLPLAPTLAFRCAA